MHWRPLYIFALVCFSLTVAAVADVNTVTGVVHDELGQPAPDLIVSARSYDGQIKFGTVCDTDGRYELQVTSPGYWYLEFDPTNLVAHGFIGSKSVTVNVSSTSIITQNLSVVRAPYKVNITLVDESNRPVTNASVTATVYLGHGGAPEATAPMPDGAAQLALTSDTWMITPSAQGYTIFPQRIYIADSTNLNFVGHPPLPNYFISGKLVDDDDKPISNIPVVMFAIPYQTNITDALGEFSFSAPANRFSADNNYALGILSSDFLVPTTWLAASPGSSTRTVLRARKITSQIIVHMNKPEGMNIYARATTRAGADEFQVWGSSDTNSVIPVFDGAWQVETTAYNSSYMSIPASAKRTVSVPSPQQSFDVDFNAILASVGTIRGNVRTQSGEPFQTFVGVSGELAGPGVGFAPSDVFEYKVSPGQWRVRAALSPRSDIVEIGVNYTSLEYYLPGPLNVAAGQLIDVGSVVVPSATAHLEVTLVDESGRPLNVNNPFIDVGSLGFSGRQTNVSGSYLTASATAFTNIIQMDITPGVWTFGMREQELNRYGYASVGEIVLFLRAGTNRFNLRIDKLPANPSAPVLAASRAADGSARFRLFQTQLAPVSIEYSTNLRDWKFHLNAYYNDEFPSANLPTNTFYRAVRQ